MLQKNDCCIDMGTVNCPCRLAEYGQCIVCSRLSGGDCCDCRWQGVCIYNEFMQNNGPAGGCRQYRLHEIQKIKRYNENLAVMRLAVSRGMAEAAALPGSFVFLKGAGEEDCFSMPVSVMKSCFDDGYLEVAVQLSGVKSRSLMAFSRAPGRVEMRGVFRSGLLGVEKLLRPRPQKVLCLAKGVGLAPASNYARWARDKDEIDFVVDMDKVNEEFVADLLDDCKVNSLELGQLPQAMTWERQEAYDVILLCASDYYQQNIFIPESKRVCSNNSNMCCGEGICGACSYCGADGVTVHMCKCGRLWK